ncbi:MAG: metallophosphoesterase [Oscillospiraceae bacterium]|jgi:predicted phosphodiesterase|nr:metallophosphoesterase [Oscillospiraceae bacterium]
MPKPILRFRDGKFKILCFSDTHYNGNGASAETNPKDKDWARRPHYLPDLQGWIGGAADAVQPDLVVFCGDNVHYVSDPEAQAKAIRELLQPIADRGLPFAAVTGNHDAQQREGLSREAFMKVFAEADTSLTLTHPEGTEIGEIAGHSTYTVPIYASGTEEAAEGTVPAFNLWFFDNNNYGGEPDGSGTASDTRILWYKSLAADYAEKNGGKPIPAASFFHCPPDETYQLMRKIKGFRSFSALGHGDFDRKQWWTLDKSNPTVEGLLMEPVCCDGMKGLFRAFVEAGDMKLAMFGHDHGNTFSGVTERIRLMYCGDASMRLDGQRKQASVLTIDENTADITRERIYYFNDVAGALPECLSWTAYISNEGLQYTLRGNPLLTLRELTTATLSLLWKKAPRSVWGWMFPAKFGQ